MNSNVANTMRIHMEKIIHVLLYEIIELNYRIGCEQKKKKKKIADTLLVRIFLSNFKISVINQN